MVTIDVVLVATNKDTRKVSTAQDLSAYLSWRFNMKIVAQASNILSPMRGVPQEVDPIAPQEESHPTGTNELPPPPPIDSIAKRML